MNNGLIGMFRAAMAIAFCCLPLEAHAEAWVNSKLTRFGAEVSYPSSFKRTEDDSVRSGIRRALSGDNSETITDGKMSVTLQGAAGWDHSTFESRWEDELRARGSSIAYKVKRDDWYAVSGVGADGTEFYTKVWLLPRGGFTFSATYPHALNAKYDPVLERMLDGFKPKITEERESAVAASTQSARVGEKQAERIVAEKIGFKPANGRHLKFDSVQQRDGRDCLVVHGYDVVIDNPGSGTGHTATWGWYYVDARTGAAFSWGPPEDKLIQIEPLSFR